MVNPPVDSTEAETLVREFSQDLSIAFDRNDEWRAFIERSGVSLPAYFLTRGAKLQAVVAANSPTSSLFVQSVLASTEPSSVTVSSKDASDSSRTFLRDGLRLKAVAYLPDSVSLKRPELVAADSSIIAVFDYGDAVLKTFDRNGRFLWSSGSTKSSKLSLHGTSDLKVYDGSIYLLDGAAQRIVILSRSGQLVRRIPLSKDVSRFTLGRNGRIYGFDAISANEVGFVFDSGGRTIGVIPTPEYLRGVATMARQSLVTSAGLSESVAVAYLYSGYVGTFSAHQETLNAQHGIEPILFPATISWKDPSGYTINRVSPSATAGAASITADSSRMFVLFGGSSSNAYRIIDIYSTGDAAYHGSVLLPSPATALARIPDGFVTVESGSQALMKLWSFVLK